MTVRRKTSILLQEHLHFYSFLCVQRRHKHACLDGLLLLPWMVCEQPRVRKHATRHFFLGSRCRQASCALPPRRHVSCRQSVTCVAPRRFRLDFKGSSLANFLYFSVNTVCVWCPHTTYLAPTRQSSAVLLVRALAL